MHKGNKEQENCCLVHLDSRLNCRISVTITVRIASGPGMVYEGFVAVIQRSHLRQRLWFVLRRV